MRFDAAPSVLPVNASTGSAARWTMVYDEGLEMRVGGLSLFSFFHYRPEDGAAKGEHVLANMNENEYYGEEPDGSTPGFVSECGRTFVGWGSSSDGGPNVCWFAAKRNYQGDVSKKTVTLDRPAVPHQAPVVSPTSFMMHRQAYNRKEFNRRTFSALMARESQLSFLKRRKTVVYSNANGNSNKGSMLRLDAGSHSHSHSSSHTAGETAQALQAEELVFAKNMNMNKNKFVVGDDEDAAYGSPEEQKEGEVMKSHTGINDYKHIKATPAHADPFAEEIAD